MHPRLACVTALLFLATAPAAAQETPRETVGSFDFGLRGSLFGDDSDEARYQRYRDLRNGPFLDKLRFESTGDRWLAGVRADHTGYRDQRYRADVDRVGRLRLSFEWNQIPLFLSEDTRTLYSLQAPGVLTLSDELQQGLQQRALSLPGVAPLADPFEARSRRDVADLRLTYMPSADWDVNLGVRHTAREGEQPWGATFGFGNAVEVAVPIDTGTTDLGAGLEWANDRATVRLGYDGSFFRNDVTALVWDNPFVAADTATAGSSRGRMALWPDSDLNSGSVLASVALPARSRATAYVSIGNWSQNGALIPFTINSALPEIPLDRPTAEAEALVTAMHYTVTSRPTSLLWLSGRVRTYDFDNRTPVFQAPITVTYDQNVAASALGRTHPYGYERRTVDAEASLTPFASSAFRVGYTGEQIDRTFRLFEKTTEHIVRVSADTAHSAWLSLRAAYEHGKRTGSGLDEEVLDDIGEQVSLRQFDISDRLTDRVSALAQLMPTGALAFNVTAVLGREDRSDAPFGLRSNDNYAIGFGFDVVPGDQVSLGASYLFERFTALQASRQANPGPQFDDPTRDWTTDTDDVAQTIAASADFLELWPRVDVRLAYDFSRARSTYVYGIGPDSTLQTPAQLPPVLNRFHHATVDAGYALTSRLRVGVVYWFEDYKVRDFALGTQTLDSIAQPGLLALGYVYRPYTANTVWGRLTYLW
jgi:MtrB/PioB family decaheme-associated outer membrane protein